MRRSGASSVAKSSALPARFYRDPAEVVEVAQLDSMGCRACSSHRVVFDRVVCLDGRNDKQKGVPRVGHRCRFFKLK
jgi:hypothetical protein